MSEYDDLISGYEPSVLATEDPGPLTDEEFQRAMEMAPARGQTIGYLEPVEPPAELRVLKGTEIPQVGVHYVIFEGVPKAVSRDFPIAEDVFVSGQLAKGEGTRHDRADRYLRTRYRGFLCGEIATL